ncbi:ComEC/Rec2 family competence protein [uncultured Phocaeicola sp.]|uniref:ComEC/Rec2 family competence protein n=1 Tax=uncultured Phocaeicola sp. TaxID=990718 RepID=UPI0026294016|nr:ComEC/Rec2 family competence protein [uncultured Phocaeicola sp.]
MFRLTIPFVTGIFVSDYCFQGALPVSSFGMGALVCLIGLVILVRWRHYRFRWLFGGMAFMFLFCVGALLVQQKWQEVNYEWSSEKNVYQGVIVDVPQEKAKTYLCKLWIDKNVSESGMAPVNRMVLVYIMKDSLSVNLRCGDHLNFYTRILTPEREVIPEKFDYAAYLFRQQISGTAVIFPGYWQWTGEREPLTWKQQAGVWREKILDSYRKWGGSGDEFAVLSALTVGYKEELSEDLRETYQTAGVSHILALSGMHIAVLWGLLCWILRPLDRSYLLRWVKCGMIVLLLWTFAFLVGLPPSVIRAVVMCMLMTMARAAGERALSLNTLAIATFSMLLYNPFYLFDTGFQLSFLAVFSILLIYPFIFRCCPVHHFVFRYIWGIVAVSLAAQLGTAPVVIYKFAYFPICFLLANLIVTPLVLIIIYGSVASFVLSPFAVLHIWVVKGLDGTLWLLNNSMQWVSDLPMSHFGNIHFSLLQVGIFYVLLFVVLSYLLHPSRKLLIATLCGINLFIGFSGYLCFKKEEHSRLILTHSQVKVYPPQNVWQQDSIYYYKGLNICVLADNRWRNKSADCLLDIDYMYLCKGFKGRIAPLQKIFRIRKIILDSSLSDYRLKLLKEECRSLGLDYIDISSKGSHLILL